MRLRRRDRARGSLGHRNVKRQCVVDEGSARRSSPEMISFELFLMSRCESISWSEPCTVAFDDTKSNCWLIRRSPRIVTEEEMFPIKNGIDIHNYRHPLIMDIPNVCKTPCVTTKAPAEQPEASRQVERRVRFISSPGDTKVPLGKVLLLQRFPGPFL